MSIKLKNLTIIGNIIHNPNDVLTKKEVEAFIKITDQEKFNKNVQSVDISNLKSNGEGVFDGGMSIHALDDQVFPSYGFIKADDFEEQYGFVIATKI